METMPFGFEIVCTELLIQKYMAIWEIYFQFVVGVGHSLGR